MTNILYLIDNMHTGGTERQLYELIQNLDHQAFKTHVCILHSSGGSYFDQLDVPKFCLSFVRFYSPSIVQNVYKLSRYIRNNKIDIVQSFFQDPTLLAALTKPFHKAKLIGSFRDLGFWRTKTENLKMRLAYPLYSGFIANSQAVKDHVVKVDKIPAEKIQVIYNGFDVRQLDSLTCKPAEPPIVGIVANLNRPVKRVQDFVEAAALVHKQRSDVRFCVVGTGDLQPGLEQLAQSLGLKDNIEFTGLLDNPLERVAKWSVGIITSKTEGFCNAIIEYMACGLPVVATDAGGNSEIIISGENGALVPVASPQDIANQLVDLLNPKNKNTHKKIAENNVRKIEHEFSISSMVDGHSDYYHRLLCLE